jgi:hypothetical protein
VEWLGLKKLNEAECKERYHIEVSNRFATVEDLNAVAEVISAWETEYQNFNQM